MKTLIGIYKNHELAVEAVHKLKDNNYPIDQLSIIGKTGTEVVDEELRLIEENPVKLAELAGTTVVGTALGTLTGLGLFAIPGVGFLYGAGAVVGAIAGFDFGLIGGGIASVLATVGIKDDFVKEYEDALNQGKFLLIAQGEENDIERANIILHENKIEKNVATY